LLITKFDHDPSRAVGSARHKRCSWPIGAAACAPQATAAQAATLAPRPPFNARVDRDNEAVLSRAVHWWCNRAQDPPGITREECSPFKARFLT
jgi:hypothetical protein